MNWLTLAPHGAVLGNAAPNVLEIRNCSKSEVSAALSVVDVGE